jgi:dynein heavy chain
MNLMDRASQTAKVVPCCQNEMLKNLLPSLYETLEQCQKSLDNYLETKRAKFPRFYFTSSTNLLIILSGGSEPSTVIPFLENLFAGISKIEFSKIDRKIITHMIGSFGAFDEPVPLTEQVKAEGNIEDWLKALEHEQQRTMKDIIRTASKDVMSMPNLKDFINAYYAQVSMLGIQLQWTHHVQEGLEKLHRDRTILNQKKQIINNVMSTLIDCALDGNLNKLERIKIEAMVTVHVHQRDVFIDL